MMDGQEQDLEALAKVAHRLIEQAESFRDKQKGARDDALRFYQGAPETVPVVEGRPKVVSNELRSAIRKVMPSVMRTLLSNDRIVEYHPRKQGDEEAAKQATDYVNAVVVDESDAEKALYDSIMDAFLLKTGILTWAAYENARVTVQPFRSKPEEAMLGLEEVGEVLDVEEDGQGMAEDGTPIPLFSFKLRRMEKKVCIKVRAVPRGAFLIHPNARSIEDSPIIGESQDITRSDLVARGYDKEQVWALRCDDEGEDDSQARRGDDWSQVESDVAKAMQTVKISDVIIQHDSDGDGVAEYHHLILGEGGGEGKTDAKRIVLHHEIVSEINYSDVVSERDAHQFEGHSLAEDVIEHQRVNTVLLRQAIDNLNWVNNPQPAVKLELVENPESIMKPALRRPIILKPTTAAAGDIVSWSQPPFIADKAFAAMEAIRQETKERTGISDGSGGLTAEQLTNTSATATAIINDAATAQAEMMIRSIARGGIRKAMKGVLKLVVANADQKRTIHLRGKWVEFDPRAWDADMDCTVNIGLGGGNREQEMMILQMILQQQKEAMASLGADNPLVKPEQVYNTLAKMVEVAGFPSAEPFFTMPDPAEIKAKAEAAANQPDPDAAKLQATMQIEQIKAQARAQVEEAQMNADLTVKRAELEAEAILERERQASSNKIAELDRQLKLLIHRDNLQLQYSQMRADEQKAQAGEIMGALNVTT